MDAQSWLTDDAVPLRREADLDALVDAIGDRRVVLLGEASHGTSEFYTWRTEIVKRLAQEDRPTFVAVEGDWPDSMQVDAFVKARSRAARPEDALRAFARWPSWMWANREVVALASWMRAWNERREDARKVGFYGLDVYSLWDSLDRVVRYLEGTGHDAEDAARRALACFEPYARDEQDYARATLWVPRSCEEPVTELLARVRGAGFDVEQDALVAKSAEAYYRAMVRGGPASWNVRDVHMMETLTRLLDRHGPGSRAVVFAHNTHVGDARATEMADQGMLNLGQLAREAYPDETFVVGFSTFEGTVVAGRRWGARQERMEVPPARDGSWDARLHEAAGGQDALFLLRGMPDEWSDQRAIGVVYHPEQERWGNYVRTSLARRYDAMLHVDRSTAVTPLWASPLDPAEPPETYPFGE